MRKVSILGFVWTDDYRIVRYQAAVLQSTVLHYYQTGNAAEDG